MYFNFGYYNIQQINLLQQFAAVAFKQIIMCYFSCVFNYVTMLISTPAHNNEDCKNKSWSNSKHIMQPIRETKFSLVIFKLNSKLIFIECFVDACCRGKWKPFSERIASFLYHCLILAFKKERKTVSSIFLVGYHFGNNVCYVWVCVKPHEHKYIPSNKCFDWSWITCVMLKKGKLKTTPYF